jgi:hypothetical protein
MVCQWACDESDFPDSWADFCVAEFFNRMGGELTFAAKSLNVRNELANFSSEPFGS